MTIRKGPTMNTPALSADVSAPSPSTLAQAGLAPADSPPSILICGGGFAGALLAIRLLDTSPGPLCVTVAEPRPGIGRGVAYSTAETVHLLNGPARIFSLHEEDPEHLLRWIRAHGADGDWVPPPGDLSELYLPRRIFGTYVEEELARAVREAAGRVSFTHLRASVVDLARSAGRDGGRLVAVTDDGSRVTADHAVLATGVFPLAPGPAEARLADEPRYVDNPWDPAALGRLADARDVLIVGASLSMVDVVASLESRGFRGRYRVISRRGHLIESRRDPEPWPDFPDPDDLPRTARALLAATIRARRAVLAAGGDWQALPAALREHVRPLWQAATTEERLRFNRHLRALWDVALHRAAPPAFATVERVRAEGRFEARAARLLDAAPGPEGLVATLRPRGCRVAETVTVDGIVNCRGHQEHDWRRIKAPLAKNLLAAGLVRPHATGFGIDATREGAVIGADGTVAGDLHALGHPLRGVAWESSSLNEQNAQGTDLARRLLAQLEDVQRISV